MNTQEVADKFIQFWRDGKNEDAIKAFYSDHTIHQTPGFLYSRKMEQTDAAEISELLVVGEYFCLRLKMDVTLKDIGRSTLNESWVFEVKGGKIVYERFFNYNTKAVLV
ncbi:SnoaL-like domain-containing protein [Pedobacter cryoconitis]|uniref:SnoaL-like domain-containing protein n=1 Tax=Pedobacter cryoconitis TaxID=188932 RepID=A0A327T2E3_9SPHI|nr:SnoaL-like domain-containing protein [Pedobacter cryoconitis]RAJ35429.1 hypothetical protein LY11_00672 [Pedobacter cryoconitis]